MHGALVPPYYNSGPQDRFGLNPLPPIVPPGTEPDLQALNNPFIAAARSSQSNLVSSHVPLHFGSQVSNQAGPDMRTNPTAPVIDPALEFVPKVVGQHSPMGHDPVENSGEEGSDDDDSQSDEDKEEMHNHSRNVVNTSKFHVLTSSLLNQGSRSSVPQSRSDRFTLRP